MRVSLIAAMATNRVIGKDNQMPWHLPADLKYFRKKTLHKCIIMGRKTFESVGRPLPKRINIVLTRQEGWTAEGCLVAQTPEQALALAQDNTPETEEIMVIGGATLYEAFFPLTSRLYLTEIQESIEGDTHFPVFPADDWQETEREARPADDKNQYAVHFVTYERRMPIQGANHE